MFLKQVARPLKRKGHFQQPGIQWHPCGPRRCFGTRQTRSTCPLLRTTGPKPWTWPLQGRTSSAPGRLPPTCAWWVSALRLQSAGSIRSLLHVNIQTNVSQVRLACAHAPTAGAINRPSHIRLLGCLKRRQTEFTSAVKPLPTGRGVLLCPHQRHLSVGALRRGDCGVDSIHAQCAKDGRGDQVSDPGSCRPPGATPSTCQSHQLSEFVSCWMVVLAEHAQSWGHEGTGKHKAPDWGLAWQFRDWRCKLHLLASRPACHLLRRCWRSKA